MENITLGAIAAGMVFLIGLYASIKKIKNEITEVFNNALKPTNKKIDDLGADLTKKIENTDLNSTKNFLVARLSEIKSGDTLDDISKERFYEQYEHYIKLGGNSYIRAEVEKLQKENKL